MVRITTLRNATRQADENWAIVRSFKSKSEWIKQVPELAPTGSLYHLALNLQKTGNWNETTFMDIYVPQFISDIANNEEAHRLLNYLATEDKRGKDIILCCYCANEELCHRSIIAGLLYGLGCNVETDEHSAQYYYNKYSLTN